MWKCLQFVTASAEVLRESPLRTATRFLRAARYSSGVCDAVILLGLPGGYLLVVAGALVLCAIVWIYNSLFYTSTPAEVLRVEERCVVAGAPIRDGDHLCRSSGKRRR
jgi:hypothetical protein